MNETNINTFSPDIKDFIYNEKRLIENMLSNSTTSLVDFVNDLYLIFSSYINDKEKLKKLNHDELNNFLNTLTFEETILEEEQHYDYLLEHQQARKFIIFIITITLQNPISNNDKEIINDEIEETITEIFKVLYQMFEDYDDFIENHIEELYIFNTSNTITKIINQFITFVIIPNQENSMTTNIINNIIEDINIILTYDENNLIEFQDFYNKNQKNIKKLDNLFLKYQTSLITYLHFAYYNENDDNVVPILK